MRQTLILLILCIELCGCNSSPPPPEETSYPKAESAVQTSPIAPEHVPQTPEVPVNDTPDNAIEPVEDHVRFKLHDTELDFVYQNGGTGKLLMVESLGGGAAWFDYDQDSRLDVILPQGGDPAAADIDTRPLDACFRQMESGTFQNVVQQADMTDNGYSQGVAVGDFDNDGFPDIYITNTQENCLYHNNGDGTFENVSATGVNDSRWSCSAAWADLDLDGDLDLYVCNYLKYDAYDPFPCEKDGRPALCHPRQLEHWPDECYENLGDGRFQARADDWNLKGDGNKGLGVAISDLTNNGYPDIYVANDTTRNFLFLNNGHTFTESAVKYGVAMSGQGALQASMGIAVGDYDKNRMFDLYLTHFTGESNTLYQNMGEFGFVDASGASGVHKATYANLGFGTAMVDFDANGDMELLVANGHIDENNADGNGYQQNPQLLTFHDQRWRDISNSASTYFSKRLVGRGVALGDYDRDGDSDVIIVHQNDQVGILENQSRMGNWLRIRFIGRTVNRAGIGTRVHVRTSEDDKGIIAELTGGTSYCSTHQSEIFIGLGGAEKVSPLEITWPGGKQQMVDVEHLNEIVTIIETP